MRQHQLPRWMPLVIMSAGFAFLVVGGLSFLTPTASRSSRSDTLLSSPPASTTYIPAFEGDRAYQHVLSQVELGPRPAGSTAGWATGELIIANLKQAGWPVETQEFIFKGVRGRNIIARRGAGPVIIVGAHYDTRPAADRDPNPERRDDWIAGANDGASGVAVLLELARVLAAEPLKNEVWLTFFDAEDRGFLEGWPFSVGARYLAAHLAVDPHSVIIVDMVGDTDQTIYFERSSTPSLRTEIWAVAAGLGHQAHFIPQPGHFVIDDHTPFLERGIPAVNIIDFDYPDWHTTADTADKVTPASLERVGQTLELWLKEETKD